MKGQIKEYIPFKSKDYFLYKEYYEIRYQKSYIHISKADMGEFMDDIMSAWKKLNEIDIWRFENKIKTKKGR